MEYINVFYQPCFNLSLFCGDSLLGHPEAAVANRRSGELISERSATSWAVPLQAVSAENFLVLQKSKTIHKLQ